jgi:hypothetical protein
LSTKFCKRVGGGLWSGLIEGGLIEGGLIEGIGMKFEKDLL